MLKAFGALPTEARAKEMTARDYLWCALNLLIDDEEAVEALCPECRVRAERGACPACGRETGAAVIGGNAAFDSERFERMKRGEQN